MQQARVAMLTIASAAIVTIVSTNTAKVAVVSTAIVK
jgi:hypothetical protein